MTTRARKQVLSGLCFCRMNPIPPVACAPIADAADGYTRNMPHATGRTCVPRDLDGGDWSQVEPILNELLARPVATAAEFEQWMLDRSEIEAACDEARANLYIASSCDTESKDKQQAFATFVETIVPRVDVVGFDLDKKQVALFEKLSMNPGRYAVLERSKRSRIELFRNENVPIQTELEKLGQEYGRIAGAQTVQFDGSERTLPQMGTYLQDADRSVRERAWRAVNDRRMADRDRLDDLLNRMIARRHQIARNAGCGSYVEFVFKDKQRFDYTPAECRAFWRGAEKHVVPFMSRLAARRKQQLGVAELRPWDMGVDPHGRAGLKPFAGGRDLFEKTARVFESVDARLGRMFRELGPQAGGEAAPGGRPYTTGEPLVSEFLDLDSRKGKRPGGYQYNRPRSRRPFIFMNAAGIHRDAMTMLHEAGHAFHSMLCASDPIADYRTSPTEFAEVASMSMEHVTMPYWGVDGGFYVKDEDLRRSRMEHLERSVSILAWIACIDSFQQWMYENPGHTYRQRDDQWVEIDQRLGEGVSWAGLEESRRAAWQRQSHIFSHPLYYIEYGIAQLGALQLWLRSIKEGTAPTIDAYIRALSLGASKPLPELFATAGLPFEFGEAAIARVVGAVEEEMGRMGA